MARLHRCPSPGCDKRISTALFACRPHWFSIPGDIRREILKHYKPGQGIADWSEGYAQAVRAAFTFWREGAK
jgi:hypothetical protein